MAKLAPNTFLDAYLGYIDDADRLCICSAEPTTYTEAVTTYVLAVHTLTSADFAIADDISGRKLTIAAQAGIEITGGDANATHIALAKSSGSVLIAVTTCDTEAVVTGQLVALPAWKINIQDPPAGA
jgi:hypothetical protein